MIWLEPSLLLLGIACLAVLAVFILHRLFDHSALAQHNAAMAVILSMVGTLYAFLLAFVGIVAWGDMTTAQERVHSEAGVLGELIRDVSLLEASTDLDEALCSYMILVVEEEWPAMATGQSVEAAWALLDDIFSSFSQFEPNSKREATIHAAILSSLTELSSHRHLRLTSAASKVPWLMWWLLALGAVVTLGFCFMLGVDNVRSHAFMMVGLSTMIGLTLYLIVAIDKPFEGTLSVDSDAFVKVIGREGCAWEGMRDRSL